MHGRWVHVQKMWFFFSSWTDHGISYYCAIRALQLEATHCMFAICAWNVTETLLGEATVF